VNFRVEQARVGQLTNYDRLAMDVWTDGRIAPLDALKESARILVTHLRLIAGAELEEELEFDTTAQRESIPHQAYATPIEDLGLGVRVYNALKRTGISNVGEVLEMLARGRMRCCPFAISARNLLTSWCCNLKRRIFGQTKLKRRLQFSQG
jgi:DNA-directed RNA polymerase subunit alpha